MKIVKKNKLLTYFVNTLQKIVDVFKFLHRDVALYTAFCI